MEKQYESVLHRHVDDYDALKSQLKGRGKSSFVSRSRIVEKHLDGNERKKVKKADRKDMLLFELARAAGARFILTNEEELHRVRIKGTMAVTPEIAAEKMGIDADE